MTNRFAPRQQLVWEDPGEEFRFRLDLRSHKGLRMDSMDSEFDTGESEVIFDEINSTGGVSSQPICPPVPAPASDESLVSEGDHDGDEGEQKLDAEVAPALIADHSNQKSVSVAIGSDLRVFDFKNGSAPQSLDGTGGHKASIRAMRYSKTGKFFVTGGDDKLVKVWDTDSWRCVYSVVSEKRVTSLAVSGDDKFVIFSDKFGVVYVVDIGDYVNENRAPVDKKVTSVGEKNVLIFDPGGDISPPFPLCFTSPRCSWFVATWYPP